MEEQRAFMRKRAEENRAYAEQSGRMRRYFIETFGCQQNEADSERLAGMAEEMGYAHADKPEDADLILVNTCAVREHAEKRAFSVTGQYKHLKEKNPELVIGVCGCMVSQETRKEKVRHSYPYVSLLFGTSMLYRFPEILDAYLTTGKRQFFLDAGDDGNIAEGIPVCRADKKRAWVSIMYGCNNFCTYCIVPYVRGRERSRRPEAVLEEVRTLALGGCREITLLGQNVNSYGRDLPDGWDFPRLLEAVCAVPGDFRVQFMTSHPKDASERLFDVMAAQPKIAHRMHLPLQSGSDRVLAAMNRRYTAEDYLKKLDYLREKIPDITVTSDIIAGFPTETEAEFEETLDIVRRVGFDQLFTFIYSPRTGTPASLLEQIPEDVKQDRLKRLIDLQNAIALEKNEAMVGGIFSVLVEGRSRTDASVFAGRTEGGKIVHFAADDSQTGSVVRVKITRAGNFNLYGTITDENDKNENGGL